MGGGFLGMLAARGGRSAAGTGDSKIPEIRTAVPPASFSKPLAIKSRLWAVYGPVRPAAPKRDRHLPRYAQPIRGIADHPERAGLGAGHRAARARNTTRQVR